MQYQHLGIAPIDEVRIGPFALLPSQSPSQTPQGFSGYPWLLELLQTQIGTAPNAQTEQVNGAMYPVAGMTERLYVQDAARIPYYGMRQVLYPDLTMTVALGKNNERFSHCFQKFKGEVLRFYHLPLSIFELKFKTHVINEVRFLALIPDHQIDYDISTVWPVRKEQ